MSRLKALARWWRRSRLFRQARGLLRELFENPERLKGTSLRPSQRGRGDVIEIEVEDDALVAFYFTILRHPRPYAFSKQFHEVMELYRYDIRERRIERQKSVNLTRLRGRDGEPSGHGF